MSLDRARRATFLAAVVAALWLAGPAAADIYWANEAGNSVGRASNDGSNETLNFIAGATAPRGVAIGGGYVYWVHGGAAPAHGKIGRARLNDPGSPDQAFVTMAGTAPASETSPSGIALDGGHLYWTQVFSAGCSAPLCGKIGRATLDGSTVEQQFIQPFFSSIGASPCGLAAEPDHLYWADSASGVIGRAHGQFEVKPAFITGGMNPCGVAFAAGNAYWANRGENTIGRASVGTGDVNQHFIEAGAGNTPCGVAADASYVYWTTANGKIWRWRLDGSRGNAIESLVTDALAPCGIAVDPTALATPSAYSYSTTTVGTQSDIHAFSIENTSSSVLNVSDIRLVGANPQDFTKTGDGCVAGGIAPGGLCILNFRFSPTAAGNRSATVQVASTATNSLAIALSGSAANAVVSPAAGLKLCKHIITVGVDGVVTLCRATNPPTATTTQALTGTLRAKRGKARTLLVGSGRTTVPFGRTAPVLAKLTARARKALQARGSLVVQGEILLRGPSGNRATVKERVTLRVKTRRRCLGFSIPCRAVKRWGLP